MWAFQSNPPKLASSTQDQPAHNNDQHKELLILHCSGLRTGLSCTPTEHYSCQYRYVATRTAIVGLVAALCISSSLDPSSIIIIVKRNARKNVPQTISICQRDYMIEAPQRSGTSSGQLAEDWLHHQLPIRQVKGAIWMGRCS